jgi:peptide/nickel transport system substrate-binding protein
MLGMPDAQTQVSALIKGEVDYLERVPADILELIDAKSGAKAEVVSDFGFQAIMRMNHLQPPFDNVKVRQAVAHAIDRSLYARWWRAIPQFRDRPVPPCSAAACRTRAATACRPTSHRLPRRCSRTQRRLLQADRACCTSPTRRASPALGNVTRQVLVDSRLQGRHAGRWISRPSPPAASTPSRSARAAGTSPTPPTACPTRAARSAIPFLVATGHPTGGAGAGRPIRDRELRLKGSRTADTWPSAKRWRHADPGPRL